MLQGTPIEFELLLRWSWVCLYKSKWIKENLNTLVLIHFLEGTLGLNEILSKRKSFNHYVFVTLQCDDLGPIFILVKFFQALFLFLAPVVFILLSNVVYSIVAGVNPKEVAPNIL